MEIIFVGTSSGRTSLNRFHSSLLFKLNKNSILIDAGDGVSKALLKQEISYSSISDIILTHYHSDHLAGLPSLLTQMVILNRTQSLKIHTHKDLVKPLRIFLETSFLFLNTFRFSVEIVGYEFNSKVTIIDQFRFIARQNSHIRNKHNLDINELKFLSSSFLFQTRNQNIVYTSDIGNSEDLYLFDDIQPDVFITETTHVNFSQIEKSQTILNPSKTYLTHIDDEQKTKNWIEELPYLRKKKFIKAEDGMKIPID
jgi:ribonuclease BN (tRNA processing enzyme)